MMLETFPLLENTAVHNKTVVVREDFNVPLDNGCIHNDARLRAALPTIQTLLQANAAVILLSHLDRPQEGQPDPTLSLAPVAQRLSELLARPVEFATDYLHGLDITPGEIILCENVRFNVGEKANDPQLAKQLAALGDVFVMDAFSCAHRMQASTYGIAQYAKLACAGPLLLAEIHALERALAHPQHPLVAIIGGAKISTKLPVLKSLIDYADQLIIGGGMANTFLAAQGYPIGASLCEKELISEAKNLLAYAKERHVEILLPRDVVVATECSPHAKAIVKNLNAIASDDKILDVGPQTQQHFHQQLIQAKTILWNGPVGVFEYEPFSAGTRALANAIAKSNAYSIAGGGDTLAAIDKFGVHNDISYISTGGGAFLEFIEHKTLPAIDILRNSIRETR